MKLHRNKLPSTLVITVCIIVRDYYVIPIGHEYLAKKICKYVFLFSFGTLPNIPILSPVYRYKCRKCVYVNSVDGVYKISWI